MNITRNFTYEEFFESATAKQKGIINYPSTINATLVFDRIVRLANVLQVARDYLDSPLRISSGYRCSQLNMAVRGVSNSKHLLGAAVDIPYTDINKASIYAALNHANRSFDIECDTVLKIIDEKGWFHVQLNDWVSHWSLMSFLNYYANVFRPIKYLKSDDTLQK